MTDTADIFTGRFASECDLTDVWAELVDEDNEACTAYFDHAEIESDDGNPYSATVMRAQPILKGIMVDDYSGTKRVHGREWCIRIFGGERVMQIEEAQYNTVNGV